MKNKYAFFSIDVESFTDTECVANSGFTTNDDMIDGLGNYIELLDKYEVKATMFALRDVALKYRCLISKCINNGHSLALHGNEHIPPLNMSDSQFRRDILRAKHNLENAFGKEIIGFRAPFFSMNREKIDILKSIGFRYDSSLPGYSRAVHTQRINLEGYERLFGEVYVNDGFYEFGNSTESLFGSRFPVSGGGYMRLSNWGFAESLVRRHIKKNDYYMFYLHPFELSKHKKPRIRNLKSYDKFYLSYGFSTYGSKIEHIIKCLIKEGYTFTTFEDFIMNNTKTE